MKSNISPSQSRNRLDKRASIKRFSFINSTLLTMSNCISSLPKDRAILTVRLSLRTAVLASILFMVFALCSVLFNYSTLEEAMNSITTSTFNSSYNPVSITHNTITKSRRKATPSIPVEDIKLLEKQRAEQRELREKFTSDLPACAANGRASSFLLVFMGHSGSTALMTSLKQHSMTYIDGLEPVDHGKFVSGDAESNSRMALKFTNEFFTNATNRNLTGGFKIRPRQILKRPREFAKLIKKFDTRIIWSYRTNVMKQAIGDYTIHHYGDKSAYEGLMVNKNSTSDSAIEAKKRKNRSFRINDMRKLHGMLKSRVKGDGEIANALRLMTSNSCVLPVSYESYLRQGDMTLERVQRFLGLGTKEMHSALRQKANQDSLCDLVENWEDVCEAFFGCIEWRWMMDDFENGCSCSSLNPSRFKASSPYCSL